MSASSKKKLRKEQQAAAMTQKQKAAAKEAKKLKAYTFTFWVIMALCVALVAGIMLKAPITNLATRWTTALVVGDHKVSGVELNYFYVDAINEYVNQYSSFISYILDTSSPLSAQVKDTETGSTWADFFLEASINSAKNTYALYDAGKAAGYTLSEEEKSAMQTMYDNMDVYAKAYGHKNANEYLKSIYGDAANTKTYKAYYEVVVYASSYYAAYSEQLKDSYTDPILREFEGKESYKYNSYTYYTYYMSLDKFKFGGTKGTDGKITYSEEEIAAAKAYIEKVAKELSDPEIDTLDKLNAAIAAMEKQLELDKAEAEKKPETNKPEDTTTEETPKDETAEETPDTPATQTEDGTTDVTPEEGTTEDKNEEGTTEETPKDETTEDKTEEKPEDTKKYSTATENKDKLYSSINSLMQEWLRNSARKDGDITAIKSASTETKDGKEVETLNGYYIVMFNSVNDNTKASGTVNVRHILVKFEGGTTSTSTGETTYSQAEKDAAKAEATKILDEWLKGAKTEDSFAELAKKYTDDSNGEQGGLYENIYRGQMVTKFNDWCFDVAREPGNYGMVDTEYGYHVMYFSSASETNYRDYMVSNDKLTVDMEAWQTKLSDNMSLTTKTTKYVNLDYIIQPATSLSY